MTDHSAPKDVAADLQSQKPQTQSAVVRSIMIAVLLGAVTGAVVGWFVIPDLMAATALGGAMMFGAARVFLFVSPTRSDLALGQHQDRSHK